MAGAPSSVRKQIISVGKWVGLVAPGGGAKVEKGRSVFPSGRLETAVTVRGCRAKMGKRTHAGTKSAETVQHGCIVQELCESRGGRPGLSVLTSLLVSVDVKLY